MLRLDFYFRLPVIIVDKNVLNFLSKICEPIYVDKSLVFFSRGTFKICQVIFYAAKCSKAMQQKISEFNLRHLRTS